MMTACYSEHIYKQAHNLLMYRMNKLHLETLGSTLIPVLTSLCPEGKGVHNSHRAFNGGGHTCNAWAEKDANLASCVI